MPDGEDARRRSGEGLAQRRTVIRQVHETSEMGGRVLGLFAIVEPVADPHEQGAILEEGQAAAIMHIGGTARLGGNRVSNPVSAPSSSRPRPRCSVLLRGRPDVHVR